MRIQARTHVSLISVSLLVAGLAACSGSSFKGNPQDGKPKAISPVSSGNPAKPSEGGASPGGEGLPSDIVDARNGEFTQKFVAGSAKQPLDLIWIIDNSSSMADNIEAVRSNLVSFMSQLSQSRTDVKMMILSQICASNSSSAHCVKVPAELKDKVFTLNESVNSHNALDRLSLGLRKSSDLGKKLVPQLRPGSKKVFVVVTDDESDMIERKFMDGMKANPDVGSFILFGFVGFERGTTKLPNGKVCEITNVGETYIDIAERTSGEMMDICAQSWTEHFQKLSTNVVNVAQLHFPLTDAAKVGEVRKVTVAGRALNSDEFAYMGGAVEIKASVKIEPGQEVQVTYGVK